MSVTKHPFVEEAELLEDLLREQHRHDRLKDGVMVFTSIGAENRARNRARELRHLADIDETDLKKKGGERT